MRHGELSNEIAPPVAFRFERLIKTEQGKLNRSIKGYIQNVLSSVDANVYIITTEDPRKAMSFLMKWGVPYTRVVHAESLLEIPQICNENGVITYYDYDINILQNVRARGKDRVEAIQWTHQEVL